MIKTDVLVIGSGIAGLTFAVKMAERFPKMNILILTKANIDETNTKYAQGGIAVVSDFEKDSFYKHIEDTLIAGAGLCDEQIVEIVVKEGAERVNEIVSWGAIFDRDNKGEYMRGKEGGHSEFRILHHKDITGYEIERALIQKAQSFSNIQICSHWFVVDLITQHHLNFLVTKSTPDVECYGVYALNLKSGEVETILAKKTLLATGGLAKFIAQLLILELQLVTG